MKGDFARITYDRTRHYSQVFQQQGRVLLEADWNEQGALMLHLLRTLAFDLMGPCWAAGSGFQLDTSDLKKPNTTAPSKDWRVSPGHFYADGILCENDTMHTLAGQPYAPSPDFDLAKGTSGFENVDGPYALWLDVWERHLSPVEAPRIKDPALNGVDTASRAQVVWQVRAWTEETAKAWLQDVKQAVTTRHDAPGAQPAELKRTEELLALVEKLLTTDLHAAFGKLGGKPPAANAPADDSCERLRWCLDARRRFAIPQMRAQVKPAESDEDPCVIAADARYRGCENQLYRVEIHDRGLPGAGATFKFSRENGSVIFAIIDHSETARDGSTELTVELADLGRDERLGLSVDDWVELLDDDCTLQQRANALLQVSAVDAERRTVTLQAPSGVTPYLPSKDSEKHPLLRRWDQRDDLNAQGLIDVVEGKALALECGIQIAFEPGGLYATGDYWVIPARVAGNGSLDWPIDPHAPDADRAGVARKASGVHHVAVLGGADADNVYRECCCRHVPECLQHATTFDPIIDADLALNLPAAKPQAKPKPKPKAGGAKKSGGH